MLNVQKKFSNNQILNSRHLMEQTKLLLVLQGCLLLQTHQLEKDKTTIEIVRNGNQNEGDFCMAHKLLLRYFRSRDLSVNSNRYNQLIILDCIPVKALKIPHP